MLLHDHHHRNRLGRNCHPPTLIGIATIRIVVAASITVVSAFTTVPQTGFHTTTPHPIPFHDGSQRRNQVQSFPGSRSGFRIRLPTKPTNHFTPTPTPTHTILQPPFLARPTTLHQSSSSHEHPPSPSTIPSKLYHHLRNLSPPIQLLLLLLSYIFHLTVLTQHALILPFQLLPDDAGRYQSIGYDSIAGMVSFVSYLLLRRWQTTNLDGVRCVPAWWEGVNGYDGSGPWRFFRGKGEGVGGGKGRRTAGGTSVVAFGLLVWAYFWTGRLTAGVELALYTMSGMGFPITIAMHRSLVVLGGHLLWVAIGAVILRTLLVPQPFFGGGFRTEDKHATETTTTTHDPTTGLTTITTVISSPPFQPYRWFTNRYRSNWLWWTIGGYFFSAWLFNIADFLNTLLLPASVFATAGEGVVSQLVNPENNDLAASLVGYIAPCVSAPWWEEVLYRGFLLPALSLWTGGFWRAVGLSGVVFSVHHVSATGALPLAVLGWTWAAVYAKSGNLLVTVLIHAMWNSRVFLGSWLGL